MKTKLLAIACIVLVAALFSAYNATAQEPTPPAVVEPSLLELACAYSTMRAVKEGATVIWCRRSAPDEVAASEAKVSVRVKLEVYGIFNIETQFYKSSWWVADWNIIGQ